MLFVRRLLCKIEGRHLLNQLLHRFPRVVLLGEALPAHEILLLAAGQARRDKLLHVVSLLRLQRLLDRTQRRASLLGRRLGRASVRALFRRALGARLLRQEHGSEERAGQDDAQLRRRLPRLPLLRDRDSG
eukprot:4122069-Prymnesium_polylepis.1